MPIFRILSETLYRRPEDVQAHFQSMHSAEFTDKKGELTDDIQRCFQIQLPGKCDGS